MTVSTVNAVLAGAQPPQCFAKAASPALVAGRPQSLWYLAGAPGAGGAPANTAGGTSLSSSGGIVTGQIPHYDPGSGDSYLMQFSGKATQAGTLLLCDRLIQVAGNSGGSALSVTSTSAQTVNSTTLPARDRTGTTNGDAILWALEVAATMGAGAGNAPTIGYTNQAGASGKSAGLVDAYVASSALGAFYRFGLQAGDTGIQSVQSFTNTATMTSGTICLVGYRVLAELPLIAPFVGDSLDALTSGFPQLFNGTVPFLVFIPNTTTASSVSGVYSETQG